MDFVFGKHFKMLIKQICLNSYLSKRDSAIQSRFSSRVEVWKFLNSKMHCDTDVEDLASMQRQSIINSLQLRLIVRPHLDNKVILRRCSQTLN